MSTLKMQESVPDSEVTQLRKQAAHKDIHYATLENELLKRNNDILAIKATLDDALYKLRNEADRAVKLEAVLNRRSEDLRAERLARENLEASLHSATEKLRSEELTSKHLEMELETYASRTAFQHLDELKRVQHEKATLEARVRALEAQSFASKPSQPPTRLPRPTTFSGAASTICDARVASLESELSKAQREFADTSKALSDAQQELAKLPRLQSKLIEAENGQSRAERLASTEKLRADGVQETLNDREEELEYLRNLVAERSMVEGQLQTLEMERDDAIRRESEMRWHEAKARKRLEEMEEKEVELVMEKEEALNALNRLQAESSSTSSHKETEESSTVESLRVTLAEREAALSNARGYTTELQQLYRDTLDACDAAETRLRDLEMQHANRDEKEVPLIVVSPPSSPSPASAVPYLAQIEPATTLSAADEAVIARLLSAVERLRSERDALRRDLHFAQVEHKVAADGWQAQLDSVRAEAQQTAQDSETRHDEMCTDNVVEVQKLRDELQHLQHKSNETERALVTRTAELDICNTELDDVRGQIRTLTANAEHRTAPHVMNARIALSTLVMVDHLQSKLEEAELSKEALSQSHASLVESRDQLLEASRRTEVDLLEAVQARDSYFSIQESLRGELAATATRLSGVLQNVQDRDIHISDLLAQLNELHDNCSTHEQELANVRAELDAVEARNSKQELSVLASANVDAAGALQEQLEILEQRVLRRTEQIGMQQHDIKRLETNLRVAEDTIGDLNAEVETLSQERRCLLEDCDQAREARDDAHKKIEALEIEVETLTKNDDELDELAGALPDAKAEISACESRIETLVRVIADFASSSKALSVDQKLTRTRLSTMEAACHAAEEGQRRIVMEVQRLASELESKDLSLKAKAADVEALTHELHLTKEEGQRLSDTLETFKEEIQSREEDLTSQTGDLTAAIQDLEGRLAASKASEDVLSEDLESAKHAEIALKSQLMRVEEESRTATAEVEKLSSMVASLEEAVETSKLTQCEELEQVRRECDARVMELEAQLEEHQTQHASLEVNHAQIMQEFVAKNEDLRARLAQAHAEETSRNSLKDELLRVKDEHAEEISVFRSQLDESIGQIEALQARLTAATDTIRELEMGVERSVQRYEAAQVEICGLEHALAGARAQLDEHDTSLQALQREKTLLQMGHTHLEAEVEKSVTKYQYLEQHAKRSDQEIMRLKEEVEDLRTEAVKFDEAAQKAEVSLSLKSVQFEQKIAMMQRELKKQQEHRHCQESIAELEEKTEYLEEMLRMKSVEIEENDDRFIEALKEKKRMNGKIESMTRKIQTLQNKLAAAAVQPSTIPPTVISASPSRPKTPSPSIPPQVAFAGPSVRPPTRIPSSPAVALRARTPEPSRNQFASRFATPEPPIPTLPQTFKLQTPESQTTNRPPSRVGQVKAVNIVPSGVRINHNAPSTPVSSASRKRRAPDDFDSPVPIPVEAIVAPGSNLTPRHLRRPTNEGRSGFTPTRNGKAASPRPPLVQPSPLRRVTAPLSEMTNSPRASRAVGLGKPAAGSKPPMRSWLNRSRPPTASGAKVRSTSAQGVRS